MKITANRLRKHPFIGFLLTWFIIVMAGAWIFYLRYPYAYTNANFYAEDGTVFLRNILTEGPIKAMFTLFNGYLVVGQYLVAEFAMLINAIFGKGFETIPKAFAVASYLFWGMVCSLPYLLFRKRMGVNLSMLTVILLLVIPLGGYDYAVIGTVGNLKFAFLFIAVLLVLYRIQIRLLKSSWRFILIDLLLLLCVLTNIVSIALLPFALWSYKAEIKQYFNKWRHVIKSLTFQHYSLMVLITVSIIYITTVYLKGIPKMPGYLDEPLLASSLINIVSRGSIYGVLFPINSVLNDTIVTLLIISVIIAALCSKYRLTLALLGFAILINIFGFVINRPGITRLFTSYTVDGGPGLFFYAGTMIFVFGLMFAIKDWFRAQGYAPKLVMSVLVIFFAVLVVPMAGSRGESYKAINSTRPTISAEVKRVCSIESGKLVEMGIYPSQNWTVTLDRGLVCY